MNTPELCLGALFCGDASGYEIKQRFETIFSHFQQASFAAIYPALTRLEADGLVTARVETQQKRPAKKIYRLTEAGRQRFIDALHESQGDEIFRSDFVLQMFFAELLDADKLAEILERHEQQLRDTLARLEAVRDHDGHSPGQRFTLDYGIAVKRASLAFIEQSKATFIREESEQ